MARTVVALAINAIWLFNLILLPKCITDETAPPPQTTIVQTTPDDNPENHVCCFKNEVVSEHLDVCRFTSCEKALDPPTVACYANNIKRLNCKCITRHYRTSAWRCEPLEKCIEEQKNPPKLPPNPECRAKHTELVGCLKPKDFRYCRSQSSHKHRYSSSSSSSLSSSSSFSSRGYFSSPFIKFIKSHEKSNLYIMNVCNCKKGRCLDRCGECVLQEEYRRNRKICRKMRCPGANEVEHHGRCVCKENYYRNKCGQCVTKDQLKNTINCLCSCPCGEHEMLRKYNDYDQRTCLNYKKCSKQEPGNRKYIVACDCEDSYYTDTNLYGPCHEKSQCRDCPKING